MNTAPAALIFQKKASPLRRVYEANRASSRAAQTARDLTSAVLITQFSLCDPEGWVGSLACARDDGGFGVEDFP